MRSRWRAGSAAGAPETVTFLSGDVHHSYVAEAAPPPPGRAATRRSRIIQAVCSPIRNPMPGGCGSWSRSWRTASPARSGTWWPLGEGPGRPLRWKLLEGPWFDNNLATLEVDDDGLRMWWATGKVENGEHETHAWPRSPS